MGQRCHFRVGTILFSRIAVGAEDLRLLRGQENVFGSGIRVSTPQNVKSPYAPIETDHWVATLVGPTSLTGLVPLYFSL